MEFKNRAYVLVSEREKTPEYLNSMYSRIDAVFENHDENCSLYDLTEEELHELMNCTEQLCLSLKAIQNDRDEMEGDIQAQMERHKQSDFPIRIQVTEKDLRVLMPPTTPRKGTKKVVMANYLKEEFYYFHLNNPDIDLTKLFHPPVVVVVKRKCTPKTRKQLQDNDNYEVGRFINVIMSELDISDNPYNVTFGQSYTTLSIDTDNRFGIEIVVFEQRRFAEYMDEFKFRLSD